MCLADRDVDRPSFLMGCFGLLVPPTRPVVAAADAAASAVVVFVAVAVAAVVIVV